MITADVPFTFSLSTRLIIMKTAPQVASINRPMLLNTGVSAGTIFQAMIETMDVIIVQKPALRLENPGKRSPPITIKEVPIARDKAFCIASRIAPICVAIR